MQIWFVAEQRQPTRWGGYSTSSKNVQQSERDRKKLVINTDYDAVCALICQSIIDKWPILDEWLIKKLFNEIVCWLPCAERMGRMGECVFVHMALGRKARRIFHAS